MPDRDPPSPSELWRRMDDMVKAHERIVQRLDILADKLEQRYIPRSEYELQIKELQKDIGAHDDYRKDQATFRRQVAGGALIGLILIVANIILTLSNVPGAAA